MLGSRSSALIGIVAALCLAGGLWALDYSSPSVMDGRRIQGASGARSQDVLDAPCTADEMVAIGPVLTPQSLPLPPLNVDVVTRRIQITNPGTTKLRYRMTRGSALPANWATVYGEIAAGGRADLNSFGYYSYLHTWTSAAETLTSSAQVCWPGTFSAWVPSATPTPTPSVTPTNTPV